MTDKVIVGFCHRSDSVAPQFRRSLTMVLMRDAGTTRRVVGELDRESTANIATARCQIVRDFLAHPARPEWLWMVDSDMTFGDGILDRLVATGHRRDRPIVGGLCFGVRPAKIDGQERFNECLATPLELFPTIYGLDDDGHPQPWFRESVLHGEVCSEDHFFCLRAGSFGYPIHLDTAAKTGHVKTFIADEDLYLTQQAARTAELEEVAQ